MVERVERVIGFLQAEAPLLEISRLNGTPWVNPAFDTSAPDWSSKIVGGHTFDGTSQHRYGWVSALNPTEEQDDEVGVSGIVLNPENSGFDLPFTHPFGGDFEFAVLPDSDYTGLLAPSNRDPNNSNYAKAWQAASAAGITVPTGLLGLEVDGALVSPDYWPLQGDRVALYGRWIVDAGHPDFHTEIHPPLLMGIARTVDDSDMPAPRNASATTLFRLWSRPYQTAQLFVDGSSKNLPLKDYLTRIATTTGTIRAYPQIFPKPFQGVHLVAFTVRPPTPAPPTPAAVAAAEAGWQLACSYHFTVNGGGAVEVVPSPADAHSLLVIVSLNAVGYPQLPEPPNLPFAEYSISSLLKQMKDEGAGGLSGIDSALLSLQELVSGSAEIYVRQFYPPRHSQTQDTVNVVPFTPISGISGKPGYATDHGQPFPIYGWVKMRWIQPNRAAEGATQP